MVIEVLRNIIYHIKFSYLRRPFGKSRFIIRQRSHSRPCILVWSAQDSSYKRRYVNIIIIHLQQQNSWTSQLLLLITLVWFLSSDSCVHVYCVGGGGTLYLLGQALYMDI